MDPLTEVSPDIILYLAYNGSQDSIEKKSKNIDISQCRDHMGRNALMHAAIGNNDKLVHYLIKKIDYLDSDHQEATALHWAARCGSYEFAKELLYKASADPAFDKAEKLILAETADGVTPLHVAAANATSKIIKLFVKYIRVKDIYERVKDKKGRSPLHYAASRANIDCVRCLLDLQEVMYFPIDQKDNYAMTPLMCAVGVNLPQAVQICDLLVKLKRTAATFRNSDGQTALHLAVAAGNVAAVKLLLSTELQVDTLDNDNRTPLHYAAEQGEVDIVKILLDNKASVVNRDKLGAVPAHYASQVSKDALKLILERSNARDVKDTEGRTCLMWAACAGNEEVVSYLLQRDVVNRKDTDNKGYTALHLAAMANQENMCKNLINQGWNPSERDRENNTSMHLAAGRGHVEVVRSLVTMSANMNDQDAVGRTPIFWAFLGGQPHTAYVMIKELGFEWRTAECQKRNSPFVDNCGRTPLHAAAFAGYPACITVLLSIESADDCLCSPLIGWKDKDGQTALHVAVQRGTLDCVKQLIRSGAGLNALDRERQTPLDFAVRCKHEHITKYLKDNAALTGEAVVMLATTTIQRCWKRYQKRR